MIMLISNVCGELYKTVKELKRYLPNLIEWYNKKRPHQALDYLTPGEVADAFVDKFNNLPTTTQPEQQLIL